MRASAAIKAGFLAAALALVWSGAQAAEMTDHVKKLYEAAKKEGELTWSVSQHNSEFAQKVADKFSELYPGVKVNVLRTTGQVQFQRLDQELRANSVQVDVYSTYAAAHLVKLKREGQIAAYEPENNAKLPHPLQELGEKGYWVVTAVSPVGIGYNTNLVKPEDAPKTWKDLLDPKWKGQVAIGHPGFSGSVGLWVMAMEQLYGWDYFKKLAANKPQIGRSIVDGVNLITSGERKVALVPTALIDEGKAKGNPVGVVYPEDGTYVAPGVTAVLKAAPHPNAARLFEEYLLGIDYSELLSHDLRLPLRPEVAPPKGVKPVSQMKVISVSVAYAEKNTQRIKEAFRDTFGI